MGVRRSRRTLAQRQAIRFTRRWPGQRNGNRRSVLVTMVQVPDGGAVVTTTMSLIVERRYGEGA